MKNITILGSTGSIGTQTLEVVRNLSQQNIPESEKYQVFALSARKNAELLEKQAREFKPRYVYITEKYYADLKARLADTEVEVVSGDICAVASKKVDLLLNALVGVAGLKPTLFALDGGNNVALANKESLVAGGDLVMRKAKEKNLAIIPVDSEHSAIFQCLQGNGTKQVKKLILTASGGAFYGKKRDFLKRVTVEDALKHPNWSMGAKVTIDSATLMNKGLEFIEAMKLFGLPPEKIEVVIHPQSILHSAVEYVDGAVIAQLGAPDMRLPIQYALTYPRRLPSPAPPLSLTGLGSLSFAKPDIETFSCLDSAIMAAKIGGAYSCAINAANEAAVKLFIDRKISFLEIFEFVESALSIRFAREIESYEDVVTINNFVKGYVNDGF